MHQDRPTGLQHTSRLCDHSDRGLEIVLCAVHDPILVDGRAVWIALARGFVSQCHHCLNVEVSVTVVGPSVLDASDFGDRATFGDFVGRLVQLSDIEHVEFAGP